MFRAQSTSTSTSIPEDDILQTTVTPEAGHWLRFNDVVVDDFVMNQASLESECFGGSYKAKSSDGRSYPVRYS